VHYAVRLFQLVADNRPIGRALGQRYHGGHVKGMFFLFFANADGDIGAQVA
jgi:hypothetical protein